MVSLEILYEFQDRHSICLYPLCDRGARSMEVDLPSNFVVSVFLSKIITLYQRMFFFSILDFILEVSMQLTTLLWFKDSRLSFTGNY